MPATPEQLLKQAIRLARAEFDMRCADSVAQFLADHHDDHAIVRLRPLDGNGRLLRTSIH